MLLVNVDGGGYSPESGFDPSARDALCALAPPEDAEGIAAGRPWAKSGIAGALEFAGGGDFCRIADWRASGARNPAESAKIRSV